MIYTDDESDVLSEVDSSESSGMNYEGDESRDVPSNSLVAMN